MKSKCKLGSNSSNGMLPLKFDKRWGFHADLGAAMLIKAMEGNDFTFPLVL